MSSDRLRISAAIVFFIIVFMGPCFSALAGTQDQGSKAPAVKSLPRMIDLGRNQCMPCKMMAPILDELKREYAGIVDIEYINVAENPDVMKKLGLSLRAVPFQIFYDASGKEVKRHYGYMSKEEILEAFKQLGIGLKKAPAPIKR
jgi:thioredoxin 1